MGRKTKPIPIGPLTEKQKALIARRQKERNLYAVQKAEINRANRGNVLMQTWICKPWRLC